MKPLPFLIAAATICLAAQGADTRIASEATNALGLDLHRAEAASEDNRLISPYSIQSALAMTYAGAEGETRAEMQRVLHLSGDDNAIHESFKALAIELENLETRSSERVKLSKEHGGPSSPIEINVANRLFTQLGYPIRPAFLSVLRQSYSAAIEELDFNKSPEPARATINRWVETQTKNRIRDLIGKDAIKPGAKLVLVNALYLRAPWQDEFSVRATRSKPFLVRGRDRVNVPTMFDKSHRGYAKRDGFQVVTLRYHISDLQFVVVLPDEPNGLAAVERALAPEVLQEFARLESREVILHLPKFRIEPPAMPLAASLKQLGMKTAFDEPRGSANFDRMAPRKPDDYLFIGAVIHKTFLALDEKGTEAAAATAIAMMPGAAAAPKPKPIEILVDRPFFFAIQHVPSGACLFLGRVTDPR